MNRALLLLSIVTVFFYLSSAVVATSNLADDQQHVMVVLDASGSMWGQLDGSSKISIVRQAYRELVTEWEADRVVSGLIAYGHRRKGDCTDIEVLASPGQHNTQVLANKVQELTPKGKTPLGAAVKLAAEELKYTEQKATVILLSDGVETCGVDPCSLGSELASLGVDFTTHVIGFDLQSEEEQAQLKCLAENTGGRFVNAQNTTELNSALLEASQALQAWQIVARIADSDEPASWVAWEVVSDEKHWSTKTDQPVLFANDLPAEMINSDQLIITGKALNYQGRVTVNLPVDKPVVELSMRPTIVDTQLTIEEKVIAASSFKVHWSGAGDKEDLISVVPVGGGWDDAIDSARVSGGNPVTLTAPYAAGEYELIYRNNSYQNNRIDARVSVDVAPMQYQLSPQEEVIAGNTFVVQWTGPGLASDMIAVGPRTQSRDDYSSIVWIKGPDPVTLDAPDQPGDYELRYYADGYVLLHHQPIVVKHKTTNN